MTVSKIRKSSPTGSTPHGAKRLMIQEFLPLSEGYALVKWEPGANVDSPLLCERDPRLPTVPLSALLRMLSALAAVAATRQTAAPALTGTAVPRVMPPENAAFMERFVATAQRKRADDLATGRMLFPEAMRERLGISRQALAQAVREHRMFALDGPSGKKIYPAFFADSRYERAQLSQVSRVLGAVPGDVKWDFFTSKLLSLDSRTPLEVLATGGELAAVLKSAVMFTAPN